jgi:hypothetical protein
MVVSKHIFCLSAIYIAPELLIFISLAPTLVIPAPLKSSLDFIQLYPSSMEYHTLDPVSTTKIALLKLETIFEGF